MKCAWCLIQRGTSNVCPTWTFCTNLKSEKKNKIKVFFNLLLPRPFLYFWGKPWRYFQNHFLQLHPKIWNKLPGHLWSISALLEGTSNTTFFSRPTLALSHQAPLVIPCRPIKRVSAQCQRLAVSCNSCLEHATHGRTCKCCVTYLLTGNRRIKFFH